MGGQHWKLLENRVMGKERRFSSAPLMFSQLLEAIKAFKPCLLARGSEICISAGGCFHLMSADSLAL